MEDQAMRERKHTGSYGVATANGFAMPHRTRADQEENATYRPTEARGGQPSLWRRLANLFKKPQPAIASVLR
jgi:hypothetical protein